MSNATVPRFKRMGENVGASPSQYSTAWQEPVFTGLVST